MVMLLHFGETYRIWNHGPLVALIGPHRAFALLGWGNYAVTMFFTVSGFLIVTNAAARSPHGSLGRLRLRDFYVRRFARLLPCLLLALAIIVGLGLLGHASFAAKPPDPTARLLLGAASVLGFVHNILMQRWGYFDYAMNVYWSLSVEEVFYLAFPLVCVALRREALIVLPCLALIVAGPLWRAAHPHNDIFYLYANLACFDAISIGVLTALLARRWRPGQRLAPALRIGGAVALAAVWLRGFGGSHKILGFTLIALATAAIILGCLTPKAASARAHLAARAPAWLGRHSYELYLFHIIVLGLMREIVPGPHLSDLWQVPWLALYVGLSALCAGLAARRLGDPANRALRRRLLSRAATA